MTQHRGMKMESTLEEKTYRFSSAHVKEDIDLDHKDVRLPMSCAVKMERKEGSIDVTTVKQEPTDEPDDVKCKKSGCLTEEEGGEDSGSMYSISAGTTHCGNAVTELGDNTCTFSRKCDYNEQASSINTKIIPMRGLEVGFM